MLELHLINNLLQNVHAHAAIPPIVIPGLFGFLKSLFGGGDTTSPTVISDTNAPIPTPGVTPTPPPSITGSTTTGGFSAGFTPAPNVSLVTGQIGYTPPGSTTPVFTAPAPTSQPQPQPQPRPQPQSAAPTTALSEAVQAVASLTPQKAQETAQKAAQQATSGIQKQITTEEQRQVSSAQKQQDLLSQRINEEFAETLGLLKAQREAAQREMQTALQGVETEFDVARQRITGAVSSQLGALETQRRLAEQEAQRAREVVGKDVEAAQRLAEDIAQRSRSILEQSRRLSTERIKREATRARETIQKQLRSLTRQAARNFNESLDALMAKLSAEGLGSSSVALALGERALRQVNQSLGQIREAAQQGILDVGEKERQQLEELHLNVQSNLARIENNRQQVINDILSRANQLRATIENTYQENIAQINERVRQAQAFQAQKLAELAQQQQQAENEVRTRFRNILENINAQERAAESEKRQMRLQALMQTREAINQIRAQAANQRIALQKFVADQALAARRAAEQFARQRALQLQEADLSLRNTLRSIGARQVQLEPFQAQAIAARNLGMVADVTGIPIAGNIATGEITPLTGTELTEEEKRRLASQGTLVATPAVAQETDIFSSLFGPSAAQQGSALEEALNAAQAIRSGGQAQAGGGILERLGAGIPPLGILRRIF